MHFRSSILLALPLLRSVYATGGGNATTSAQGSSAESGLPAGNITSTKTSPLLGSSSTSLGTPIVTITLAPAGDLSPSQCWDQWKDWWNSSSSACGETTTVTETLRDTSTFESPYTITDITTYTTTFTIYEPGHPDPVATIATSGVFSGTYTFTAESYSTGPITAVVTETSTSRHVCPTFTVPSPVCTMPAIYSKCQSDWDDWATSGAGVVYYGGRPDCSWASLGASQCQSAITSLYDTNQTFGSTTLDAYTNYRWHPSVSVGPSCTIGCQGCAVVNDKVRLLHWPLDPAPGNVTSLGQSTKVVAVVDGSTLTSPTIYVSYETLYASNSCGQIGNIYSHTIIPLPEDQHLSSMVYQPVNGGRLGFGFEHFAEPQWVYSTVPFNFGDLREPIPSRIYARQPWCQSESAGASVKFNIPPPCPTNIPYAPIIAMPTEVLTIDPAWASCTVWYGGAYDPPTALRGTTLVDTVTRPHSPHTTPASPSSSTRVAPLTSTPTPVMTITTSPRVQPTSNQSKQTTLAHHDHSDPTSNSGLPGQDHSPPGTSDPNASVPEIIIKPGQGTAPTKPQAASNTLQTEDPVSLNPGQTTTINGIGTIVAESSALVIDGITKTFSQFTVDPTQASAVTTIGGHVYTIVQSGKGSGSNTIIGGGSTIIIGPGHETGVIDGQTISAVSSGVVIGTATLAFPTSTQTVQNGVIFTAGGQTYTALDPQNPSTSMQSIQSNEPSRSASRTKTAASAASSNKTPYLTMVVAMGMATLLLAM